MHDIVCFVFYQSSVLVIEVIIGDMSKKMCMSTVCANEDTQNNGWMDGVFVCSYAHVSNVCVLLVCT